MMSPDVSAPSAPVPSQAVPSAVHSPARRAWRVFSRDRLATASLGLLCLLLAAAALAQFLPLQDPIVMHYEKAVQPPSWEHPLGTDSFGRDLLARVIWGARLSLAVGLGAVALGGVGGVVIGLVAGQVGGSLDSLLMRFMDALFTFPSILLAVALIGAFGRGVESVILALAVVYTPSFARQARAEALSIQTREYVQAALAVGVPTRRLLSHHILPNILGSLIVRAATFFAYSIIAESSLSFLGLGAQPPTPTWGGMLSEARPYLERALWYPLVPGLSIMLTVLALNQVGDRLVESLSPQP